MSHGPVPFAITIVVALILFIHIQSLQTPIAFAQSTENEDKTVTLESKSDQETFLVKMEWTQALDIGRNNTFKTIFIEPETGKELEEITYDFIVISSKGQEIVHKHSSTSTSAQSMAFSAVGSYIIKIGNIDGLGEDAEFEVSVTPELFAPNVILIAAASMALATFFGAKFRKGL